MTRKFLFSIFLTVLTPAAFAAGTQNLSVTGCWIRALPDESAAYFTVHNAGDKNGTLKSVDVESFGMAMLHKTQNVNGVMKMSEVDSVSVPAHGEAVFAPGAYHVMLMDAKKAPSVGSSLALTLSFANGGKLTSSCVVKGPDATGP